ncbi:hypothetical protein [Sphingobium sp. IP1]|uniref:hypothetical protein n=1 Tax=Sphingobium sp. IP1 TaxID=2021637 RepID=UPI0015D511CF|nr:hypothetical protein [Sphingobium sp. IP1]
MKRLIRAREHALDREIDVAPDPNPGDAGYFTLLDLLGRKLIKSLEDWRLA